MRRSVRGCNGVPGSLHRVHLPPAGYVLDSSAPNRATLMVADSKYASGMLYAPSALRVPSSAGESGRESWFQRRASRLRRSTVPSLARTDSQKLQDVFSAEAPRTVPTPAEATGELLGEARMQSQASDWSPTVRPVAVENTPPTPSRPRRRTSADTPLAPPFTTPQPTQLARANTLSVRTKGADQRVSVAAPPISGTLIAKYD